MERRKLDRAPLGLNTLQQTDQVICVETGMPSTEQEASPESPISEEDRLRGQVRVIGDTRQRVTQKQRSWNFGSVRNLLPLRRIMAFLEPR